MDTATGRLSGAGWFPGANGSPPFTFVRWKPQATVRLNHYVPDLGGSHDVKVGYEFQIDSSPSRARPAPFPGRRVRRSIPGCRRSTSTSSTCRWSMR